MRSFSYAYNYSFAEGYLFQKVGFSNYCQIFMHRILGYLFSNTSHSHKTLHIFRNIQGNLEISNSHSRLIKLESCDEANNVRAFKDALFKHLGRPAFPIIHVRFIKRFVMSPFLLRLGRRYENNFDRSASA